MSRTEDTQPGSELPEVEGDRRDSLPRWSVPTWVAVLGLALFIAGSLATYAVTRDHVATMELRFDKHIEENTKRIETVDSRFRDIEINARAVEQQRMSIEAVHDRRITLLEERWSEVLSRLSRIESKLDDQNHTQSRRSQR